MERPEAARAALEQMRQHLLTTVALPLRDLKPERVWRWRHQLHVLHHFARNALGEPVTPQTEALLNAGANLWRLLSEHEEALEEIKDYKWARGLSAASDLAGISEEITSGEDDTIRDILLDAAMFVLNWQSNTYWVNAGRKAHRAMARNYLLEIQDELWEFLRLSWRTPSDEMTLEQAQSLGRLAERLMGILSQAEMPTNAQVALLVYLYQWILRLRMGRLLITLEELAQGESPSRPETLP